MTLVLTHVLIFAFPAQACYQSHGMSFAPEALDQTDMIIIGCVAALVVIGIIAFLVVKFFIQP